MTKKILNSQMNRPFFRHTKLNGTVVQVAITESERDNDLIAIIGDILKYYLKFATQVIENGHSFYNGFNALHIAINL